MQSDSHTILVLCSTSGKRFAGSQLDGYLQQLESSGAGVVRCGAVWCDVDLHGKEDGSGDGQLNHLLNQACGLVNGTSVARNGLPDPLQCDLPAKEVKSCTHTRDSNLGPSTQKGKLSKRAPLTFRPASHH